MARQTAPDPLYAITPEPEARELGGGVRVRVVRAGWFRPDAGGFFGVVPRPLWSRFVETELGPLLEHDARRSLQLLPTLRAYLEHGTNKSAAAM